MRWLKRIGVVLLVVPLLAIVLPVSLNNYIPQVEQKISAQLNSKVTIKNMSFSMLPVPAFSLEQVTIGDGETILLGKWQLIPDFFASWKAGKIIATVHIDTLILKQQGLDGILRWARSNHSSHANSPIKIARIDLNKLSLKLDKPMLDKFDVQINMGENGAFKNATVNAQNGRLNVLIRYEAKRYQFSVKAEKWLLPIGPALRFDELQLKGWWLNNKANFNEVRAKLYGGSAIGKATLKWKKGLRIQGKIDVQNLELTQIAAMMSPESRVSGKLDAKTKFAAAATTADRMMTNLQLNMIFNVKKGVLHGVDIQKAASSLVKQDKAEGDTHFERLSGHLALAQSRYEFTQLNIVSGSMAASGRLAISAKQVLSGRINAHLKGLRSSSVPLNIGGTVTAPALYPTGGTMAGAALGTLLLGPGIGTSLGVKVGGWLEGVFSRKEVKKARK